MKCLLEERVRGLALGLDASLDAHPPPQQNKAELAWPAWKHKAGFKREGKKKLTCQESKRNQPIIFSQPSYVHRLKWSLMCPSLLGIISGLMSSPTHPWWTPPLGAIETVTWTVWGKKRKINWLLGWGEVAISYKSAYLPCCWRGNGSSCSRSRCVWRLNWEMGAEKPKPQELWGFAGV